MENSEINTHKYTQLIFDEETAAIQLRMFIVQLRIFNKWCRSNWPKQDRKEKHISLT